MPGIGPKTAQRLTYYLFHVPLTEVAALSLAVSELREKTVVCSVCKNIGETDPCSICTDQNRDRSLLCVVEEPLDIIALEKTGFRGLYHVLGGRIDPLNNIGPEELYIKELMNRLNLNAEPPRENPSGFEVPTRRVEESAEKTVIKEIILATNPNMEGEATAMYLVREIRERLPATGIQLKITRIGRGLPTGADIEYADEVTLTKALEGRREY